MAGWLWNGVDIAETANGGRYAVEGLYDDGSPSLSPSEAPRLLMRVGRPHVQRWPDVRRVSLGVYVWGATAQEAEGRLLALRGLLGIGARGVLGHALFDGRILEMPAVVTRFETATKAPNAYRVALEFESIEEPYFRDTTPVTTTAKITAANAPYLVDFVHTNPGLEDRGMVVRFYGPCTNPLLINLSADPSAGLYIGYTGTIVSGGYVEFRVAALEAYTNTGTPVAPADIVHSGDRYWFVLLHGDNSLRFGADDSGGQVEIIQNPPY